VLGNNTRILVIVTPDGQFLQLAETAPRPNPATAPAADAPAVTKAPAPLKK
jgi:hypothetical protein